MVNTCQYGQYRITVRMQQQLPTVQDEVISAQDIQPYRGARGVVPRTILGTTWRSVASLTSRPIYPQEKKNPISKPKVALWAPHPACTLCH
jgi:hypothetical protein